MLKIVQAWVPPTLMPRVLANIMERMETRGGVGPYKKAEITEFKVCDDRGGSGNYMIRFEEDRALTAAMVKAIVGKDISVTMEDL